MCARFTGRCCPVLVWCCAPGSPWSSRWRSCIEHTRVASAAPWSSYRTVSPRGPPRDTRAWAPSRLSAASTWVHRGRTRDTTTPSQGPQLGRKACSVCKSAHAHTWARRHSLRLTAGGPAGSRTLINYSVVVTFVVVTNNESEVLRPYSSTSEIPFVPESSERKPGLCIYFLQLRGRREDLEKSSKRFYHGV